MIKKISDLFHVKIRRNICKIIIGIARRERQKTTNKKINLQGKKFIVTSHYAGQKDLNTVLQKIAENRAYREIGLKY